MMSDEKKRTIQPFHERPIGDILQSIDAFLQDAVKYFRPPRHIPVYQYDTDTYYIIEAELPGVNKEQVTLDIYHNYIKISVQSEEIIKETNDKNKTMKYNHRFEKAEKIVQIPYVVKESEVKAQLVNGILTIKIPNNRKPIKIE